MTLLSLVPTNKELRYAWADAVLRASIANQIKGLREQAGWSQKRLAQAIGTAAPAISKLENVNDKTFPSVRTLRKIAAAFDVALIIRFESWNGWLTWIIDAHGSRIIPFNREIDIAGQQEGK